MALQRVERGQRQLRVDDAPLNVEHPLLRRIAFDGGFEIHKCELGINDHRGPLIDTSSPPQTECGTVDEYLLMVPHGLQGRPHPFQVRLPGLLRFEVDDWTRREDAMSGGVLGRDLLPTRRARSTGPLASSRDVGRDVLERRARRDAVVSRCCCNCHERAAPRCWPPAVPRWTTLIRWYGRT